MRAERARLLHSSIGAPDVAGRQAFNRWRRRGDLRAELGHPPEQTRLSACGCLIRPGEDNSCPSLQLPYVAASASPRSQMTG